EIDVWNAHFSELGTPLAAARGIPVVVTLHNEYAWVPNDPASSFRALDPLVDRYVAVSESVARFCATRFALARERVSVVRNALAAGRPGSLVAARAGRDDARGRPPEPSDDDERRRAAFRAALGIPADAELLLQVGRLDPVKAPHVLIEAVAALAPARPRVHACLVGAPADREIAAELRARIAALGLAERVVLTGRRHDVGAFLEAADVFVLPSVIEGL